MGNNLDQVERQSSTHPQSGSQLRALGHTELARLGEESLKDHLVDTAILAHQLYAPVVGNSLNEFIANRDLLRHPIRISFEMGSMAPHQFAQPEQRDDELVLCVHPDLKNSEQDLAYAVAYFVPVINYGALINDDHCLVYGATLFGLTIDEYYQELCRMANRVGAPSRDRHERGDRF